MLMNKDIIFVIALMTAIVTMNAFHYDEQANGHKLWNSLPFTRKEIVSARYVSLLVITAICTILVFAVDKVLHDKWAFLLWEEWMGSFVLMMVLAGIFFPLIYKLSERKTIFTFVILYILCTLAGVYGFYYSYMYLTNNTSVIQTMGTGLFWSLLVAGALVWYFISWGFSIKIYKAKELT